MEDRGSQDNGDDTCTEVEDRGKAVEGQMNLLIEVAVDEVQVDSIHVVDSMEDKHPVVEVGRHRNDMGVDSCCCCWETYEVKQRDVRLDLAKVEVAARLLVKQLDMQEQEQQQQREKAAAGVLFHPEMISLRWMMYLQLGMNNCAIYIWAMKMHQ